MEIIPGVKDYPKCRAVEGESCSSILLVRVAQQIKYFGGLDVMHLAI